MNQSQGKIDEEVLDELKCIIELLLEQYEQIAPRVRSLKDELLAQGETLDVDHIGIRTFAHPVVEIDLLATVFTSRGYKETGTYHFPEKHIRARSFSPPVKELPRVFLSELSSEAIPKELWEMASNYIELIDTEATGESILGAARNWPPIHFGEYRELEPQSQYAAWVLTHGVRVNHISWSVNSLMTLDGLEDINEFLVAKGFTMEVEGASAKDKRAFPLAQSSTKSDAVAVAFAEAEVETVSGGYLEFAHRFRDSETRQLFDGFIAPQAIDIFESTRRTE